MGVSVRTLSAPELYAPGPDGPVFGRRFDLALISWQSLPVPDCALYASWEMPAAENQWVGTNIAGLQAETYDQACASAALALPEDQMAALADAERVFLEQLPAVPLFAVPSLFITKASVCPVTNERQGSFSLNAIEAFQADGACQ